MEILAELYGEEGAQAEKAIELHRQLLQLNPYREESYKALLRTYAALGQLDAQWCCARTMSCLRMAEEGDEASSSAINGKISRSGDRLTEELWQNLLAHEDQGANLTAIFEGILPAVRLKHARPLKAFDWTSATPGTSSTTTIPSVGWSVLRQEPWGWKLRRFSSGKRLKNLLFRSPPILRAPGWGSRHQGVVPKSAAVGFCPGPTAGLFQGG